jgi:hypothetical protein
MREMRNAYIVFVRKPEGKRQVGRHSDRCNDNKMDLKVGWEDVDWIHLAQDMDEWWAPVNTVMNLLIP